MNQRQKFKNMLQKTELWNYIQKMKYRDNIQPNFNKMKTIGVSKAVRDKKKVGYRVGCWSTFENLKYVKFLVKNKTCIDFSASRRKKKIFLRMSDYIETRNADQCRSHHQKYSERFKTIDQIINHLEVDNQGLWKRQGHKFYSINIEELEENSQQQYQQLSQQLSDNKQIQQYDIVISNEKITFTILDSLIKNW